MNINVESHFSKIPRADIQRSVFDRSHSLKTSFNVGDLVPICCEEILPGDTVKMTTSKVIRLQTLLTPIMDNIYAEVFWFYTPFRILWKHYREFCGENTESAWVPSTTYTEPKIASPVGGFVPGTIADYLGYPVNVEWSEDDELAGSALPFRAYAHICNEWFRDANLKDPLLIPDGDAYQVGTNGANYIEDVANGGKPFKVAKWHDRYTSCLPAPQYGEAAGISISGEVNLPVISSTERTDLSTLPMHFKGIGSTSAGYAGVGSARKYDSNASTNLSLPVINPNSGNTTSGYVPDNLFATVPDGAFSFDVNQMRLAFATQRYLEKMAYGGGNRYTTMLRVLFGVTAPDASLQRPEYLGGNRVPLNVSEVTNNAQTENEYLGDLGGMSSTADRHYDFIKSFSEAGYLIGCVCLRYKHSYTQGMPRKFTRTNFLDYYQPTFANLGNMPVYSAELYANDGNLVNGKSKIFGYQEAWSEYRFSEDRCSGLMRPDVQESLASWHLADNYSETPTLSSEWIDEDKTNVDRVLAVTSEISDQAFADFYFEFEHTRPMPMYSIPGLIDHF